MSEKIINFDNKKINKSDFYKTKRLVKIDDINIDKILVLKKTLWKKRFIQYFISYEDRDYIGPLCIKLPRISDVLSALTRIKQFHLELLIIIY